MAESGADKLNWRDALQQENDDNYDSDEDEDFVASLEAGNTDDEDESGNPSKPRNQVKQLDGVNRKIAEDLKRREEENKVQDACSRLDDVWKSMNDSTVNQEVIPSKTSTKSQSEAKQSTKKRTRNVDALLNNLSSGKIRKKDKVKNRKNSISQMLGTLSANGDSSISSKSTKKSASISERARQAAANARNTSGGRAKLEYDEEIKYAGETMKVKRYVDAGSAAAQKIIQRQKEREAQAITSRPAPRTIPIQKSALDLDTVVANLDNPKSISTIEKSSADWDVYKQTNKLDDELNVVTKDGYIHRQEFLSRAKEREYNTLKEHKKAATKR